MITVHQTFDAQRTVRAPSKGLSLQYEGRRNTIEIKSILEEIQIKTRYGQSSIWLREIMSRGVMESVDYQHTHTHFRYTPTTTVQ